MDIITAIIILMLFVTLNFWINIKSSVTLLNWITAFNSYIGIAVLTLFVWGAIIQYLFPQAKMLP